MEVRIKLFWLVVFFCTCIFGQSRKDLLWEYKKMRDNDAHLGIALAGNINSYTNNEIKAVLNQAWRKKETIVYLQLLGYLQNPICYIQVFTDETIQNALNRFSQSVTDSGEEQTLDLLRKVYQSSQNKECLPFLINEQGFIYNNLDILLRVFKKEMETSLWVRPLHSDMEYRLLKTYTITDNIVSTIGPKSALGDNLTPEGIYTLEFYPSFHWSDFYLAFKVSYPNDADEQRRRFWKIGGKAGGAINLHGCCISIGCIPVGNPAIEELFLLIRANQKAGSIVNIHIFPFNFYNQEGQQLMQLYKEKDLHYYDFWQTLKDINTYFLSNKQIPLTTFSPETGYYIFK